MRRGKSENDSFVLLRLVSPSGRAYLCELSHSNPLIMYNKQLLMPLSHINVNYANPNEKRKE